jgi:nicotinamide mononucleotide (NMN) deamidase PncC
MGTVEWPVRAHVHRFEGDRDAVRRQTVTAALELLLAVLSPAS